MTTKCRQYAIECTQDAFNADGSHDGDSPEFMEALMGLASEFENEAEIENRAEFEYETKSEEADFESFESDFEDFDMDAYIQERERINQVTSQTACVKVADQYRIEGGRWLEEWFPLTDQLKNNSYEIADALEVINWYLFQLSVKLRRAINGKIEDEFDFMDDVYGSAKVVLIGADRSLASWQTIQYALPDKKRNSLEPVLKILKELIRSTEAEIPEARGFKRPGFDD